MVTVTPAIWATRPNTCFNDDPLALVRNKVEAWKAWMLSIEAPFPEPREVPGGKQLLEVGSLVQVYAGAFARGLGELTYQEAHDLVALHVHSHSRTGAVVLSKGVLSLVQAAMEQTVVSTPTSVPQRKVGKGG